MKVKAVGGPGVNGGLADGVYQRLLREILSGRYRCGDELKETVLAREYNLSRTPIREALRRLAAHGLVRNSLHQRSVVTRFSRQEVIDTYGVRKILEAGAAEIAAGRVKDSDLAVLRRLAQRATPWKELSWQKTEWKFDLKLHSVIAEACDNHKLRQEMDRYRKLVRLVRSMSAKNPDRVVKGHEEHLRIIEALEARDAAQARQAMSDHIDAALKAVLEDVTLD